MYSDPDNILGILNNRKVIIYITVCITGNNLIAIYSTTQIVQCNLYVTICFGLELLLTTLTNLSMLFNALIK